MEEAPPSERIPSPKETLRAQSAYFERHPEQVTLEYLNNLYLKLPDSGMREFYENSPGVLDTLMTPSVMDAYHSDLRKSQTMRQFLDAVAEVVKTIPDAEHQLIKLYLALRQKGYSHYDLVQ